MKQDLVNKNVRNYWHEKKNGTIIVKQTLDSVQILLEKLQLCNLYGNMICTGKRKNKLYSCNTLYNRSYGAT